MDMHYQGQEIKFTNGKEVENHPGTGNTPESFALKTYDGPLEESEKLERANQYWESRLRKSITCNGKSSTKLCQ